MFYKNGNSLRTLNLDTETFEKLFPAIETMAIEQGALGDCYLVSAICDFLKNPDFKNVIYQMFEKDGDDIIVRILDAKDFPVRFKNGILQKDGNKNMNASLGVQMLEEAYKKTRALKYGTADKLSAIEGGAQLNAYKAFLPNQKAQSYMVANENQKVPSKDELLDFIQNIDETIEDLSKKVKPDLKKTGSLFGDLQYYNNEDLKQKIAQYESIKRSCFEDIDSLDCYHNVSQDGLLEKLIESIDSGCIVSLGSKQDGEWLNRAKLVHSRHAYSVLGIDKMLKQFLS